MRLHLPCSLRKSLLSCLVASSTLGSDSVWAATGTTPQNLVFDGGSLTWDTNAENKAFTNAAGEASAFATGDNVIFADDASVSLGEDISAGQINIASEADVVIELADNGLTFDTLSMLGGSLDAGSSLNIGAGETLAVGSNGSVLKSALVLEKNASLSVDYSGSGTATSLNNSSLSLQGDTQLQLSGCGNGDGKTYTLLTGVSELRDSQGNTISLGEGNNAISSYFDTTQPGSGFWADSTLVLTADGSLQLVRHNKTVKKAVTFTTRRTSGADYQYYAGVCFKNIEYTTSSSSAAGGAIYGDDYSTITLSDNGSVLFRGNTASSTITSTSSFFYANGGAIYGSSSITLSRNGSVEFSENTAFATSSFTDGDIYADAHGGAIYGSTITLSDNGSVTFRGNTASCDVGYHASITGGAIYGSTITLSDNGSVTISGNAASGFYTAGGAICGSAITLSDNRSVIFRENTSSGYWADGGAIFAYGNLSIQNNDSVLFEKNAEISDGTYRLRSIYAGGRGDSITFSAAANKSIEFRDSIYIASDSTVAFNADYTDAEGKVHKQQGDILFTGAYAEQHLNELLTAAGSERTATAEEILNSRTTEVWTITHLYGGHLRVEDGAVYRGYGITVHEGSSATVLVKDATLDHSSYDLTFNAGTTLELAGSNTIIGNLQMLEGSTFLLHATDMEECAALAGNLSIAGGMTLAFDNDGTHEYENKVLLYVSGEWSGWDAETLTVTGSSAYDRDDVSWVNNLLILNYNEETFSQYFNGIFRYDTRQISTGSPWHHYQSLDFKNIITSSSGGAIYGSSITLSGNRSVTFSGNSASGAWAYGGAIYGDDYSTITLSDNESVEFSGNSARGSSYYGHGGAIYGGDYSTITLSDNGSVTFSGNTASGPTYYYARGGAIYGDRNSSIALSNNGSVTFSGNTASDGGSAIYAYYYSTITLSGNESVTFSGNTASDGGGAIYGDDYSTITLSDNGSVTFSGNSARGSLVYGGGVIYASGNLNIRNNDSVLFEKNAEVQSGTYRLRSIYAGGRGDSITFSAAANKSIEFRDSIYIASDSTVAFNADYTDAEGKVHKQTGDIIFTGATTVDDLYKVKGDVDGTEAEILASRTSEINTMTHLYGGRLRVEDDAVYKGWGITAHAGSDSTVLVKDAVLSHADYELHFYEGTKLEALGTSEIFGDVIVESTATAAFSALTRLEGSLTLASGSTLLLEGALTLDGALVLGTSLTLGGNMLEMVNLLQAGQSLTLMSGLDSLAVQTGESEYTTIASGQELLAADYFSNLDSGKELVFVYNGEAGSLSMMRVIPEPATATLSLLALTALMSRRRRK